MNAVLVDASSAILLFKASLFETMCDVYPLAMVPAVVNEITVENYAGAADFKRALATDRIEQISMPVESTQPEDIINALGDGERDTILAFGPSQAHFILMDDAKGARACRNRNIPYINALLCPELLYEGGHLQRSERDLAFKQLLSIGRYASGVVAYAHQCRGKALAGFHPLCGGPNNFHK